MNQRAIALALVAFVAACGGAEIVVDTNDGSAVGAGGAAGSSGSAGAAIDASGAVEAGPDAAPDWAVEKDRDAGDGRSQMPPDGESDHLESGGTSCPPNVCCFGEDGSDVYPAGHLKPDNQCMLCDPAVDPFEWTPGTKCPVHEDGCACVSGAPTEVDCADNYDNDLDGSKDCLDVDCDGALCRPYSSFYAYGTYLPAQEGMQMARVEFSSVPATTARTIFSAAIVLSGQTFDPRVPTVEIRAQGGPVCVASLVDDPLMHWRTYTCDVTNVIRTWFDSSVPTAERIFVVTGTPRIPLSIDNHMTLRVDHHAMCEQKNCPYL